MTVQDTSPTPMCLSCFTHHRLEEEKISMHTTNCYVNKQYFKENEAAIMSRIVMPIEDNQTAAPTSADNNVSQTSTEYSKT